MRRRDDARLAGVGSPLDRRGARRVEDHLRDGVGERKPPELALDAHAHRDRHDAHGNGARQVFLDRLTLELQRSARELDRRHARGRRFPAGDLEDLPRPRRSCDGEAARHDLVDARVELVCELLSGVAHITKDLRPIDGGHLVLLDGKRHALLPYRAR